jgi:hypothetical protein
MKTSLVCWTALMAMLALLQDCATQLSMGTATADEPSSGVGLRLRFQSNCHRR